MVPSCHAALQAGRWARLLSNSNLAQPLQVLAGCPTLRCQLHFRKAGKAPATEGSAAEAFSSCCSTTVVVDYLGDHAGGVCHLCYPWPPMAWGQREHYLPKAGQH